MNINAACTFLTSYDRFTCGEFLYVWIARETEQSRRSHAYEVSSKNNRISFVFFSFLSFNLQTIGLFLLLSTVSSVFYLGTFKSREYRVRQFLMT